ncbi:MAG: pyridoxamine 5'-phosphate oxidase family protein [Proteobacteria bacterium]|nr:pyridoxamine 5'-phosphate oxidase family protein [Burkholderiales bacterium]
MSEVDPHSLEAVREVIKDVRFAMFTTQGQNGELMSRPMTTQQGDDQPGPYLWFFMSRSGDTVREFTRHAGVNVAYADPHRDSYASICGRAEVVEDMAKKKALWSVFTKAWFPGGLDDPDLALVRVDIESAEYWIVRESNVVQMFKMAKAAATGTTPSMGEHGTVRL